MLPPCWWSLALRERPGAILSREQLEQRVPAASRRLVDLVEQRRAFGPERCNPCLPGVEPGLVPVVKPIGTHGPDEGGLWRQRVRRRADGQDPRHDAGAIIALRQTMRIEAGLLRPVEAGPQSAIGQFPTGRRRQRRALPARAARAMGCRAKWGWAMWPPFIRVRDMEIPQFGGMEKIRFTGMPNEALPSCKGCYKLVEKIQAACAHI